MFGYDLVNQYPHDSGAFTEGLILDRGECDSEGACKSYFWESTGSIRPDILGRSQTLCRTSFAVCQH